MVLGNKLCQNQLIIEDRGIKTVGSLKYLGLYNK